MRKIILIILITIGVVLLAEGIIGNIINPKTQLGNIQMGVSMTNASSTASSSVSLALAEKSGAQLRTIANTGSNTVYLFFNTTSTGFVAKTGYVLFASSVVTMCDNVCNLPMRDGNVWQITESGTSSLAIGEL